MDAPVYIACDNIFFNLCHDMAQALCIFAKTNEYMAD